MTPEWNPNMEELNKRRVERHLRRRKEVVRRRRRRTLATVVACLALIVLGLGVFFLVRRGENKTQEKEQQATQTPGEVSEDAKVIHLVAAGDVNVTDAVIASGGADYDYTTTFMDVLHLLADGDITVVNFEGNLCGAPYGDSRSAPQSFAEALNRCGVDLVQLANSYSIYQGISGLQTTIQGVKDAGMEPLGVYADERAYKAGKGFTIKEVEGVKIAFVAFTKGMDGMTLPQGSENCVNVLYSDYDSTYQKLNTKTIDTVLDAVAEENPDLTVAMLHWGSEYNDNISKTQEDLVAFLQERGVDAILGTHPHYVHKITHNAETGQFVAYSLGDLISDGQRAGTEYSIILDLEIAKTAEETKIVGYSYTPIFTVAERGSTLRSVRIAEAMVAYEDGHIRGVKPETYEDVAYALTRVQERINGE